MINISTPKHPSQNVKSKMLHSKIQSKTQSVLVSCQQADDAPRGERMFRSMTQESQEISFISCQRTCHTCKASSMLLVAHLVYHKQYKTLNE